MSIHQKRRVAWLWAPSAFAGVAMILAAVPLTMTLNGLGLAGMTLGSLAVLGAVWDEHMVKAGWLR